MDASQYKDYVLTLGRMPVRVIAGGLVGGHQQRQCDFCGLTDRQKPSGRLPRRILLLSDNKMQVATGVPESSTADGLVLLKDE